MIQRARLSPRIARPTRRPILTIDATTAHITAPPELAAELADRFRREYITCSLRQGAGVGGLDLLDFGDPSFAEERRIRRAFAAWQKSHSVSPQRGGPR